MSGEWIADRVGLLVVLLMSLSVHEWAHAISAYKLGDDTASSQGRLTLNPLAHADPIGTLLLPLLGVPFGWARPVPVNPVRFRRDVNMRSGMMITAAAGPFSNVVLALVCAVLIGLMRRFVPEVYVAQPALPVFLGSMVRINVVLALFNMLPVPPLDGSRVADGLMPRRLRPLWDRFYRVGPIALLALIVIPPLLGFSLIQWPMAYFERFLGGLIQLIASGSLL